MDNSKWVFYRKLNKFANMTHKSRKGTICHNHTNNYDKANEIQLFFVLEKGGFYPLTEIKIMDQSLEIVTSCSLTARRNVY